MTDAVNIVLEILLYSVCVSFVASFFTPPEPNDLLYGVFAGLVVYKLSHIAPEWPSGLLCSLFALFLVGLKLFARGVRGTMRDEKSEGQVSGNGCGEN